MFDLPDRWEGETKGGTATELALDPDRASVLLNDLLRDREAKPGPLGFARKKIADLAKFLAYRIEILGCDSRSLVDHLNRHHLVVVL